MKKMSKMVEEQPIISGELLSNQGLWVLLSDKAENLGIFDHKFQISGSQYFSFDDSQNIFKNPIIEFILKWRLTKEEGITKNGLSLLNKF